MSADERLVLRGPAGYGEAIEAEALVSSDGFSARYYLDHTTGVISREAHELYGQSLVGKVLVVSTAKGGTATGWRLADPELRLPLSVAIGLVQEEQV